MLTVVPFAAHKKFAFPPAQRLGAINCPALSAPIWAESVVQPPMLDIFSLCIELLPAVRRRFCGVPSSASMTSGAHCSRNVCLLSLTPRYPPRVGGYAAHLALLPVDPNCLGRVWLFLCGCCAPGFVCEMWPRAQSVPCLGLHVVLRRFLQIFPVLWVALAWGIPCGG